MAMWIKCLNNNDRYISPPVTERLKFIFMSSSYVLVRLEPDKKSFFFINIWNQPAKQASSFLFVLFRCVKHGVIVNNKEMLPASVCSRRFAVYVGGFIVVHLFYTCHTFQASIVAVACFCQRAVYSALNNQTNFVPFPLIYGHMDLRGRL